MNFFSIFTWEPLLSELVCFQSFFQKMFFYFFFKKIKCSFQAFNRKFTDTIYCVPTPYNTKKPQNLDFNYKKTRVE